MRTPKDRNLPKLRKLPKLEQIQRRGRVICKIRVGAGPPRAPAGRLVGTGEGASAKTACFPVLPAVSSAGTSGPSLPIDQRVATPAMIPESAAGGKLRLNWPRGGDMRQHVAHRPIFPREYYRFRISNTGCYVSVFRNTGYPVPCLCLCPLRGSVPWNDPLLSVWCLEASIRSSVPSVCVRVSLGGMLWESS